MNKSCWLAVALLAVATAAQADDSQAVSFARQACIVAGAAQACGQPIALMISRTDEVIAILATGPDDVAAATGACKRAMEDSAASQTLSQKLTCNKVVTDYNNLPLLQPDYQQQVIAPLTKDLVKTTPATGPTQTNAAATTSTTTTNSPSVNTPPPMPAMNASPMASATTAPASGQQAVPVQQVVTANTAPTIPLDNNAVQNGAPAPTNPNTTNLDAQRVQMAQKLTEMASSLLNSTQPPQFTNSYSQNVINQQLNGVGANNPAFSNSLGVQPYASGQSSNAAIAATGDSQIQPYTTTQPAVTQPYPP